MWLRSQSGIGQLEGRHTCKRQPQREKQLMKAGTWRVLCLGARSSAGWRVSSPQHFLGCVNLGIEGPCPPGKIQELPKTLGIHLQCLNQPPLKLPGSSQVAIHGETSQFRGNGCTSTWQLQQWALNPIWFLRHNKRGGVICVFLATLMYSDHAQNQTRILTLFQSILCFSVLAENH